MLPGFNSIAGAEKVHRRVQSAESFTFAIGVIFEFVAWKCSDPILHHRIELVGILAFGLVVGFEIVDRIYESRIDELKNAEIAKWKSKTQEADSLTNQIVLDIAIQQEPRHISPSGKEFLKNSLSQNAGQRFQVFVDFENEEGRQFAAEILDALKYCGWFGSVNAVQTSYMAIMPAGIAILTSDFGRGSLPGVLESANRILKLNHFFREAGVHVTQEFFPPRDLLRADGNSLIPENTIAIYVGKKPIA